MDEKEVLRYVINGFELIPAKFGFSNSYTTKTGKATKELSKIINDRIKKNFPQTRIKTSFDPIYKTINFHRSMLENRIRLVDLLEIGDSKRVPKDRIVYAYTFPEQNLAYIGLTGDEKKRAASHKSLKAQKTTAVSRYIREMGLEPTYEIVSKTEDNPSGWVDENTAKDLECKYMEEYKANGWQLLNLAPCGSLGGSVRDEKIIINSLDDFMHSASNDLSTLNLLPGSDYTVNAIETYNFQDEVFKRIQEIVKANNITSTRQLRKLVDRRVSKLIEDWSAKHRDSDNWQARLFPENTRGLEKPKEAVDAFLADPTNLDKDQLKLITKRAWKGLEPEQEKAFLNKLKNILDKYKIDTPGKIDALAGNTTVTWMLSDQSKNNPENAWKDKLFPGGYPGKGTGRKRASVSESLNTKDIFKRIIESCCHK